MALLANRTLGPVYILIGSPTTIITSLPAPMWIATMADYYSSRLPRQRLAGHLTNLATTRSVNWDRLHVH